MFELIEFDVAGKLPLWYDFATLALSLIVMIFIMIRLTVTGGKRAWHGNYCADENVVLRALLNARYTLIASVVTSLMLYGAVRGSDFRPAIVLLVACFAGAQAVALYVCCRKHN